jgi:hypothetical protein
MLMIARTLLVLALYAQADWRVFLNRISNNVPSLTTQVDAQEALSHAGAPQVTVVDVEDTQPAFRSDRIALMLETRPNALMVAVISHFISVLPSTWPVHLVATQEVFAFVNGSTSLPKYVESGKIVLRDLPEHYPIDNNENLSRTLTNLTFYSEFLAPAEWVLVFQTDSMICSASPVSVDDWVEKGYDWVGAPWNEDVTGGNGGLSLRHLPPIIDMLKNETRQLNDEAWEDLWLCSRLKNLPTPAVAKEFSVESVYHPTPVGYHLRGSGKYYDGAIWHNVTRMQQIFEYCPETKLIFNNLVVNNPDMLKALEAPKPEAEKNISTSEVSG